MPQRLATVVKIGSCQRQSVADPTLGIQDSSPKEALARARMCAALLLNPADIVVIDATTPEQRSARPSRSISAGDGRCCGTRSNSFGHDERVSGSLLV